MFAEINI